jgi:glycosyltransferase involved in cell wall biosynthesis
MTVKHPGLCWTHVYYSAEPILRTTNAPNNSPQVKIALDTSFLERPPSGIGAYVSSLKTWLPIVAPGLELAEIHPEPDWSLNRLGTRGARFAWEYAGAGIAARKAGVELLHMPMMATPVISRMPVVATIHDVIPFLLPEYRTSRAQHVNLTVARRAIRRAAAIITVSHHAAEDIAAVLGIPRDRIWVTYEAADGRYVPITARDTISALLERMGIRGPYIFNIGGVDVRKNLPVLIRAFHQILPEIPESIQLVIGGAPHSDNPTVFPPLAPLIHELGLDARVVLTGRVSEEDKLGLMQGATVYVTPSLYEGFGLSVLEAMACGIPAVAANRTSFPEIVGDAGLLTEPRVQEVADAMRTVLTNEALRVDLAHRGVERARQFHWRRTAEETVEIYRHVLSPTERQS